MGSPQPHAVTPIRWTLYESLAHLRYAMIRYDLDRSAERKDVKHRLGMTNASLVGIKQRISIPA